MCQRNRGIAIRWEGVDRASARMFLSARAKEREGRML